MGDLEPEDGPHQQDDERPAPVDNAAEGIRLIQKSSFLGYHWFKHLTKELE